MFSVSLCFSSEAVHHLSSHALGCCSFVGIQSGQQKGQWSYKRVHQSGVWLLFGWLQAYACQMLKTLQQCGSNWALHCDEIIFFVVQVFKRHNPSTAEEQEMMENLFDSLCSCLMLSSNRDRFLKGEGLQLMNLMLRYCVTWWFIFLPAFDPPPCALARYLYSSVYKICVLVCLTSSTLLVPSQRCKLYFLNFPKKWI